MRSVEERDTSGRRPVSPSATAVNPSTWAPLPPVRHVALGDDERSSSTARPFVSVDVPTDQRRAGRPAAARPLPPAAEFYVKALRWPVRLVGDDIAVECGRTLDVIEVPANYGPHMRALLRGKHMRTPIIAVLDEDQLTHVRWAFMCGVKSQDGQHAIVTQLAANGILHIGQGIYPLPPSVTANSRHLQWVYPAPLQTPTSPLLSWADVATCALAATRKPVSRG